MVSELVYVTKTQRWVDSGGTTTVFPRFQSFILTGQLLSMSWSDNLSPVAEDVRQSVAVARRSECNTVLPPSEIKNFLRGHVGQHVWVGEHKVAHEIFRESFSSQLVAMSG